MHWQSMVFSKLRDSLFQAVPFSTGIFTIFLTGYISIERYYRYR